jgi:hypothetical protein
MKTIAAQHSVGIVGSVNPDGTPNVSPKGTMVVLDEYTIIFAEIASPQSLANIKERPSIEINFVDVLARRCFRAKGKAEILTKNNNEFKKLFHHFQKWESLTAKINHIIRLNVEKASIVSTPAYSVGETEEKLVAHWKNHFANL